MCKVEQMRKYNKIITLLVLCLFTLAPLYPAIVMRTSQTEMKIVVTDRVQERNTLPSSSLILPLCSIAITAKHQGRGYLKIFHTSLTSGFEEVPYTLYCDDRWARLSETLSYICSPSIPLTIPLTNISAHLTRALQKERSSYTSEVFFHLIFEL